jgi:hypothetical protein
VTSTIAQSQKHLRELGYIVAKTEHWNHFAKCKQDLFGLIDTLAAHPEQNNSLLAVQSTDGAHLAQHRKKILVSKVAPILMRHLLLEIWSWSKMGGVGKRKLWTLRRERFTFNKQGKVVSFKLVLNNIKW